MNYTVNKKENYTILVLEEEKLDTTVAPDLKSEFIKIQTEGSKSLIINLSKVKYTDSSGLSALLVGNRLFGEEGNFVLCEVQEHVMKLIGISQLDKVINIQSTQEEAADSIVMAELGKELGSNGGEA
ncbi:MAG: STAS domain-containing protein [Cyclobacteriaceae bacterium]|nr:STAS domain-containing protein [Cyclobacteriaceae bacterium HetDA_MAG_MS6]